MNPLVPSENPDEQIDIQEEGSNDESGFTRSEFFKLSTAAVAAVLAGTSLSLEGCAKKEPKPSLDSQEVRDIIEKSKVPLDARYTRLKAQVNRGRYKVGNFGSGELGEVRNSSVYIGSQFSMLKDLFKDILVKPLKDSKIKRTWKKGSQRKSMLRSCKRNTKCWKAVDKSHDDWKADQLKEGKIVKMEENSSSKPYYCQQVGGDSGLTNNRSEAMYMDVNMEPIIQALVGLVNYQIDMFNKDPRAFGYSSKLRIKNIDAVKISGAFRSFNAQYGRVGSATRTGDLSAHLTGRAIDIGALTPKYNANTSVVRFKDDTELKASDTRNPRLKIISKMIGRAFLSMKGPLASEGITIKTLWEKRPQNWHVVINKK